MASLNSLNSMKFMIVLLDAVPQIHLDNSLGQIAFNTGRFWRRVWLDFHIASIFVKSSGHVDIVFYYFVWYGQNRLEQKKGCESPLGLEVGNYLGGINSGEKKRLD